MPARKVPPRRKIPPTPEEEAAIRAVVRDEYDLFFRVRFGTMEESTRAVHTLFGRHRRLVAFMLKWRCNRIIERGLEKDPALEHSDFQQTALRALLRAISQYDFFRLRRFSSYA